MKTNNYLASGLIGMMFLLLLVTPSNAQTKNQLPISHSVNYQAEEIDGRYGVHTESDKIISSLMLYVFQIMVILVGGIVYYEVRDMIQKNKKNK